MPPIVDHNQLPSFQRLRHEGQDILSHQRASQQDIREIHIGLLNLMPDAALEATERQFFRLINASNRIAQFHIHLFTLPQLKRNTKAQKHIATYYEDIHKIKEEGLDGLIITGATPRKASLEEEEFWEGLTQVVDWAKVNVTSTLCSCLASHAIIQYLYGLRRQHLNHKCWGVYPHSICTKQTHPLITNLNSHFDVPHSRYNDIPHEALTNIGLRVLVSSDIGVHLAVSPDLLRFVFLQGHPEYDRISLLKEYHREIQSWFHHARNDYPQFPENFFNRQAKAILMEYQNQIQHARHHRQTAPSFPESLLHELTRNTWRDSAKSLVSNWLGLVYQYTNSHRSIPFMDGIDPDNPLGLR